MEGFLRYGGQGREGSYFAGDVQWSTNTIRIEGDNGRIAERIETKFEESEGAFAEIQDARTLIVDSERRCVVYKMK